MLRCLPPPPPPGCVRWSAGGADQDGVAVVLRPQCEQQLPEPLLHAGVGPRPLPRGQHAAPGALGLLLHPLEPTHAAAGELELELELTMTRTQRHALEGQCGTALEFAYLLNLTVTLFKYLVLIGYIIY